MITRNFGSIKTTRFNHSIVRVSGEPFSGVDNRRAELDATIMITESELRSWFTKKYGEDNTDPKWPTTDSPPEVKNDFLKDFSFSQSWNDFLHRWKLFSESYQQNRLHDTPDALDSKINGFRAEYSILRQQGVARGANITTTAPKFKPKEPPSFPWVAIAVAGAGIGYVLYTQKKKVAVVQAATPTVSSSPSEPHPA